MTQALESPFWADIEQSDLIFQVFQFLLHAGVVRAALAPVTLGSSHEVNGHQEAQH